ncbi:MAG: hypothetical protein LQ352_001768 [Teloschistes flavicans]|nr:MAG: hypothetical protein LQ352_001768 [Teloschistes flavicans]
MEKSRSTEEDALGIEAKPIQTPAKNSNDRSGTAVKGLADSSKKAKAVDSPSTCTLIISQSLAHSNYASPRPCPIDPAVFFDLVRVRRLVEEATDLAVRAANGTTSSSLRSSLHAGNNFVKGGGSGAAALGLTFGSTAHTKLSRERKHRMRDLATQKLSYAYQLDEIAASVATMQSTSSLEEVAKLVLQRNSDNSDAKYVHFFHEKIPSRMLDESTNLQPLNEIVHARPTDAALLRTRAITRIFKNDLPGAVEDLNEALAISRYMAMQHKGGLALSSAISSPGKFANGSRGHAYNSKEGDEAKPSSLEPQLLFHRAGVYLTLACHNIPLSLDQPRTQAYSCPDIGTPQAETRVNPRSSSNPLGPTLGAQKLVKSYAKRALRDYLGFLAFFEYTPGMPTDLVRTVSPISGKGKHDPGNQGLTVTESLHEAPEDPESLQIAPTRRLSPYKQKADSEQGDRGNLQRHPQLSLPCVLRVSSLFSSSLSVDLPPYPVASRQLAKTATERSADSLDCSIKQDFASAVGSRESVTFHPLLTESLHALLLCHSLIQTSPKEHLRHAHMVARLVRLCDGYPIFLAARSPSRADWMEILRQADNWIGLEQSWDSLCAPAPLPGHVDALQGEESLEQNREYRWQEAIMDSLADERVQDEATFQAAVTARERRANDTEQELTGLQQPEAKRSPRGDGTDFPIGSERAAAIVRWVTEASPSIPGSRKPKRGRKKPQMVPSCLP